MNVATPIPRAGLERFGRLLSEYRKRQAKAEQSQRGWYDDDGVRQGGLIAFIRYFWHILEPETPLEEGWALYAIVEHLEAVTFGEITRLLITVPPGFMKSLCTDVFWPAWEWGPMDMAHKRYVAFAYSASLTERDNERFRDLVTHDSYRVLYSDRVVTVKVGATKVTNRKMGWKLASSVGGVGTGERGNSLIIDDAHNVKEAESETVRSETVRWFRESVSDRLNSMKDGVIVVIMQRSHEDDVAGCILELGLPYVHLMIPMEYDWDRQTTEEGEPKTTVIGWFDPRYVSPEEAGSIQLAQEACDGMLAWEERFPVEAVAGLRVVKGPYAYAGQYQQAPAPRGGGIFQRGWWQLWEPPDGKFPVFSYILASLDSAYTEKEENDPSGLTVWGVFQNEDNKRRIMLVHAWRKHLQFSGPRVERLTEPTMIAGQRWPEEILVPGMPEHTARFRTNSYRRRTQPKWGLMEWVADTCTTFKVDRLLIEAKASGISAAQELVNRFGQQSWGVQLCPVEGDKYARAIAVQPTFSQLMIYAPAREWAEMVIDELAVFPKGKFRDLTDSTSQALKHMRDIGLAQSDEEATAEEIARVTHRPRPRAIYPV